MKTFFNAIFTKLQAPESSTIETPKKYASPEKKHKEYEEQDPDNMPAFLKLYRGLKEDIQEKPKQGPR